MKRTTWLAAAAVLCGMISSGASAEGLRNLPPTKTPRFEIKPIDWPAKPGEASLCLWKDDKLAAASITIDDNLVFDHPWWQEMARKYDFKFTWFVISGKVDGANKKVDGTWTDWQKLREAGHDIQSHTVDHFSAKPPLPAEENYRKSIEQIEKNLPGHKVLTLAYPGGEGGKLNDVDIAAKYYIAARGVAGHLNNANTVNYVQTNSISGPASLSADHFAGLPNLIELNPKRKGPYRGWVSMHFHGVNTNPEKGVKDRAVAVMDYLTEHRDAFWVAPFTPVAQYGQERDTATLSVTIDATGKGKIQLSDKMDDACFDFPLTVKVRLAEVWGTPKAVQNGKPLPVRVIKHEDAPFALIDIVPDRGDVIVSPGGN